MSNIIFPCDCKFKVVNDDSDKLIPVNVGDNLPLIDISTNPWDTNSIYRSSLTCDLTWNLFAEGRTKGVFQLEKNLGQNWSKKLKPDGLNDLAALVSLLRPGCLRAMSGDPPKSMTQRYVDRKHKVEETIFLHKSIEDVLIATHGVLVYQEQAMQIAERVAGFNKQEADVLRKAIGKKKADIMAKVEKEFLDKAHQTGILTDEEAKEIFGWIRESQKYSFNKSHAVAYGMDSYMTAYIKAHFPIVFFASWITGANWKNADKYDEIAELVNDAKLHNVTVKTPQLSNISANTCIVKNEYVQFGLSNIRGIGPASVTDVEDAVKATVEKLGKHQNNWNWLETLLYFCTQINSKVVEGLISVGAFDYMGGGSRNYKIFEYNKFSDLTKTEIPWLQQNYPKLKWVSLKEALIALMPVRQMKNKVQIGGGGTATKKREDVVRSIINVIEKPGQSLDDTITWIATTEERFLGTPISCTKIDSCLEAEEANSTCSDFVKGNVNKYMVFAVEVVNVDEKLTKNGKNPGSKMAGLTIRDSTCSISDVVCFPKEWKELSSVLQPGNTILMLGEKTRTGSLSIKKAREIS